MPHPTPPRGKPAINPDHPARLVGPDLLRAKPAIRRPATTGHGPGASGDRRPASKRQAVRNPDAHTDPAG